VNKVQAYDGYFENGRFHTLGRTVYIPERRRVFLTVLEEPPTQLDNKNKKNFWAEFDKMVDESAEENKILCEENFQRLRSGRKLILLSDEGE
jgi:hypothetical protein